MRDIKSAFGGSINVKENNGGNRERSNGEHSGGQTQLLERRPEKPGQQRNKAAQRRSAINVPEAERRSGKDYGVAGATDKKTLTIVSDEYVSGDSELNEIRADAEKRGLRVTMFTGSIEFEGGDKARGWYDGNGNVFISVDNNKASARQIYDHEIYHTLPQETKDAVVDSINAEWGGERLTALTDWYAKIYQGVGYSDADVFE